MSYGPHIPPLRADERAGVELPCAAPDCDETVLATLDTETVEAARDAGRVVRVSTPETVVDKWVCSPEHADVYREAVRSGDLDVEAARVVDADGNDEIEAGA